MKNYFTEEQERIILKLYTEENRGQLYCAKAVGSTNVNQVKKVLQKYGVHIRNFSEAASKSNQNRAKGKNKDYFKHQSSNMAWLLGFLASDGSISSSNNTIKIGLAAKDREILEKIKEEVEIENKIVEWTTKEGFECVDLHWTCAEHKQDLGKFGITPRKTFTLKPPMGLERQYFIDFIRGYFDGDGSINLIYSNNKPSSLRWQICGGTREILEWIVDILYKDYQIPPVKIYENKNRDRNNYYFQYSTTSTKKIWDILYTPNNLKLERKYSHFKEIIQMI